MKKKHIIIAMLITIFGVSSLVYGQGKEAEFTEQDKRGVAFAEADAQQAIKDGKIYVISGGEGNEPIVNEADLALVKGIPTKSIGCTGDMAYAEKFNKTIIKYLKMGNNTAKHSYKPKEGYVPDEATAIKIAEAVWLPIYGDSIYKEKPFRAKLKDGVWTAIGSLPEGYLGGVAEIEITKDDGKILRVNHGR